MRVGDWDMRIFLITDDHPVLLDEHFIQGRTVVASHPGKQLMVEVRHSGAGADQAFQLNWNETAITGSTIGPYKSVRVRHVRSSEGRVEIDFPLMFEAITPVEWPDTADGGGAAGWDWSSSVFSLQPLQITSPGRTPTRLGPVKSLDNVAASESTLIKKGLSCGVQYGTGVLAATAVERANFTTRHSAPPLQLFIRDRMLVSLATPPLALPMHTGTLARAGPMAATAARTRRPPRCGPEYVDLTKDAEDIQPCVTPPRAPTCHPEDPPRLKRRRV